MGFTERLRNARVNTDLLRRGQPPTDFYGNEHVTGVYRSLAAGDMALGAAVRLVGSHLPYLMSLVTAGDGVPTATVRRWDEAEPTVVSGTLVGQALTRDAWMIRGGKYADFVDEKVWEPFADLLAEADAALHQTALLYPDSALPWAARIPVGMGLGASLEELRARFDEAHERDPWNYGACYAYLQASCDKWHGSHAQMLAFAREAARGAPRDSPARGLLALAHVERSVAVGGALFPVLEEDEYDELAPMVADFVLALSPVPSAEQVAALQVMAAVVDPRDPQTAAAVAAACRAVGPRCAGYPWTMVKDPLGLFDAVMAQRLRDSGHILQDWRAGQG